MVPYFTPRRKDEKFKVAKILLRLCETRRLCVKIIFDVVAFIPKINYSKKEFTNRSNRFLHEN
jgi:hypothetical protein